MSRTRYTLFCLAAATDPVQDVPAGLLVDERLRVVLQQSVVERHAGGVQPVRGHRPEVAGRDEVRADVAAELLGRVRADEVREVAHHRRLADVVEPRAPDPALPQQPAAEADAAQLDRLVGAVEQPGAPTDGRSRRARPGPPGRGAARRERHRVEVQVPIAGVGPGLGVVVRVPDADRVRPRQQAAASSCARSTTCRRRRPAPRRRCRRSGCTPGRPRTGPHAPAA